MLWGPVLSRSRIANWFIVQKNNSVSILYWILTLIPFFLTSKSDDLRMTFFYQAKRRKTNVLTLIRIPLFVSSYETSNEITISKVLKRFERSDNSRIYHFLTLELFLAYKQRLPARFFKNCAKYCTIKFSIILNKTI